MALGCARLAGQPPRQGQYFLFTCVPTPPNNSRQPVKPTSPQHKHLISSPSSLSILHSVRNSQSRVPAFAYSSASVERYRPALDQFTQASRSRPPSLPPTMDTNNDSSQGSQRSCAGLEPRALQDAKYVPVAQVGCGSKLTGFYQDAPAHVRLALGQHHVARNAETGGLQDQASRQRVRVSSSLKDLRG